MSDSEEDNKDPEFQLTESAAKELERMDESGEIRRSNRLSGIKRALYQDPETDSSSCSDDDDDDDDDVYIDPCEVKKVKKWHICSKNRNIEVKNEEKCSIKIEKAEQRKGGLPKKKKTLESEYRRRYYERRKRAKVAATEKKYDDIFSAVVETAKLMEAEIASTSSDLKVSRNYTDYTDMYSIDNRPSGNSSSIDTSPFDSDSDSDEDIIIERTVKASKKLKKKEKLPEVRNAVTKTTSDCSCGEKFDKHFECHEHILRNHYEGEFGIRCDDCGMEYMQVYDNNVCTVCGDIAIDLNDHIASHYRSSTGKGAVMECRFCVKQYRTIREVMDHEKEKHTGKIVKRGVTLSKCPECGETNSYEAHLLHLTTHIQMNLLWGEVETLQAKIGAESEECPFCRHATVSSRRGFKAHVIKVHYAECKALVTSKNDYIEKSDVEVKKEVMEMTETCKEVVVKREVKEEIVDAGYLSFHK